jgi:hypothetical protein
MNNHTYTKVRAVYHEGVLTVLDPLTLPEGTQVRLDIHAQGQKPAQEESVQPGWLLPAEALRPLIGIMPAGGDALEDSEALYDPDWD